MGILESITKTLGLESLGKSLGLDWFESAVPSFKKALEIATKSGDKGFLEKVGIFWNEFNKEMDKLDKEKEGITAETQDKVQATLQGAVTLGEGSVVDQMKMRLNGRQREMACLIENIFTKRLKQFDRDLSDEAIRRIVAAALVNVNQESKFNPNAAGDSGNGIGLFQVHPWGGSVAYRKVPENNINLILDKEVFTGRGKTLIRRAKEGADIAELTALFSKYIERPGDEKGEMEKRANVARNVFRGGVTPAPQAVASAPSPALSASSEVSDGKSLRFDIDLGGSKKGGCDLSSGQKNWFFGSSGVVGVPKNIGGRLGIVGIGPREFLRNLKDVWWDKIENAKLQLPEQIVLTGMAQNSVSSDSTVRQSLAEYGAIRAFLSGKGVSVVKFITIQPSEKHGESCAKFNKELKKKYGGNCIDVSSQTTVSDGTKVRPEFYGDGTHLNRNGKKEWNRFVIAALNRGSESS
ncbi:MAG: phage tail tip lysozyme [Candidatus Gracilibacteria bacterium]|jgi:hypothetical protein